MKIVQPQLQFVDAVAAQGRAVVSVQYAVVVVVVVVLVVLLARGRGSRVGP